MKMTLGTLLEEGKETDIVDHKKEDEPENYTENTCYVDGYTGDYNCKWCGEKVQEGSIIAKKSHEYKDDVCVNCGRVNNAVYGKEYSMKTTAQFTHISSLYSRYFNLKLMKMDTMQ